jgi:hypothetical protein
MVSCSVFADDVRANDSANSLVEKGPGGKVVIEGMPGMSPDASDMTSAPSTPEGSLTESDIKPIVRLVARIFLFV